MPPTIANTYAEEFGTNIEEVVSAATMYALDYNLSSHLTVVYDSTYYGTTYDELFYFAESELEAERPIMLGGLGHWRIAYGYNQQAFVTHEGYIGDDDYYDNEILKSSLFLQQSITDVVSLHFDYSHHFHSLNYQNSFGQFYCFCGYVHSNTHSYNFDYEYVDSNYHKAYCGCGNYITAYHTFKTNFHNNPCPCGASLWD